jgi:hypothetical protein
MENWVEELVKTYGKWPAYIVLLLGAMHGIGPVVVAVLLHHIMK